MSEFFERRTTNRRISERRDIKCDRCQGKGWHPYYCVVERRPIHDAKVCEVCKGSGKKPRKDIKNEN